MTTLNQIIGRSRINPKIARRRLRDAGYVKPRNGWAFRPASLPKVARIVRGMGL